MLEESRTTIGEHVPPKSSTRPSMSDVATLADVSAQTVSRYFSGRGYVGEDTRRRIAAAVQQLGYVPNRAAGSLRARHSGIIGLLNVGELNYGAAQILGGVSAAARRSGRMLMIAEVDPGLESRAWNEDVRSAVDHFLSAPVDGIIVSTALRGVDALLAPARERVQVVNLSARPRAELTDPSDPSSTVGDDATRHLVDLGHTRIAHLVGPRSRSEALDREAGYLRAMAEADLPPILLEGATDWWATSGAAAADRSADLDVTAVFAANDELALGFMSRMAARGLHAPSDYSIVGVDDMPSAAFFDPPLTTISIDFTAIGEAAFDTALRARDAGGDPEMPRSAQPLVVRESTGPPPRR